jgi:predicted nuclease with TOPRIM domain
MSDALIASLQSRIADLTNETAQLKSENKDRRIKLRDLRTEIESVRKAAETATAEAEALRAKAGADPASADDRVKALEAQLKARDVRDAFSAVELAPGIKVEQVFKFFDVDPNTVDVTKAVELAKGWREAAPGLFKQAAETVAVAPGGATGQALDLGHLAGRGSRDKDARTVTYTRAEVAQAGWQHRRPELVQALKDGSATLYES